MNRRAFIRALAAAAAVTPFVRPTRAAKPEFNLIELHCSTETRIPGKWLTLYEKAGDLHVPVCQVWHPGDRVPFYMKVRGTLFLRDGSGRLVKSPVQEG